MYYPTQGPIAADLSQPGEGLAAESGKSERRRRPSGALKNHKMFKNRVGENDWFL